MVKVPVAPQVQPQVQQEQVAAPQFQAAPSPGMQSAMQLGQDLMRAGQMAMGLERDKQALAEFKARQGARSRIAAREQQDRALEANVKDAINSLSITVDEIYDEYEQTQLAAASDRSAFDSRVQQAIQEGQVNIPEGVARDLYLAKANSVFSIYNRNAKRHQLKQQRAYELETDKAEISSLANTAARSFSSVNEPDGEYNVALGSALKLVETTHAALGLDADDPIVKESKRKLVQGITDRTVDLLMNAGRFDDVVDHVETLRGNDLLDQASAEIFVTQAQAEKDRVDALADVERLTQTGQIGGTVKPESVGKLVSAQGVDVVGVGAAANGRTVILAGPVDGETPGDTAERLRAVGLNVHYAVRDNDLVKFTVSATSSAVAPRDGATNVARLADGSIDVAASKAAIESSGRSDRYKQVASAEVERIRNTELQRKSEQEAANARFAKSIAHGPDATREGRSHAHRVPARVWLSLPAELQSDLMKAPPSMESRDDRNALHAMMLDRSKTSDQKMQWLDSMSSRLTEQTYNKYRDIYSAEGTGKPSAISDRSKSFESTLYRNGFSSLAAATESRDQDLYGLRVVIYDDWEESINAANEGRAARDERPLTRKEEEEVLNDILAQRMTRDRPSSVWDYIPGPGPRTISRDQEISGLGAEDMTLQAYQEAQRVIRLPNADGSITEEFVSPTEYGLAAEELLRQNRRVTPENVGVEIQMRREKAANR